MKQLLFFTGLTLFFVSCRNLKEPELRGIENVSMSRMALKESVITLQIRYYNPNPFHARIKQAEGDAWMDSAYLGHFRMDSLVEVPASSEFLVPVNLKLAMKDLLLHSASVFANEEVTIRIKGTARAGRNGFYKNFPLKYEGKQNLAKLFK